MEYRKTSKGDAISVIGIGSTMMHEIPAEAMTPLFDEAERQGVNLIDLAMSYPEPFKHIGNALAGRREKFFIQMHLGMIFPNGQYERTRDLEKVRQGFEEQLQWLQTDYIDFGFIHYVDDLEDYQRVFDSGVFDYAKQLKQEGAIRYLGVASHVADICLRFIETGDVDLVMFSVNPAYDLNPIVNLPFDDLDMGNYEKADAYEQRQRLYRECEKRGIGLQVMKAFGGGILLDEQRSPLGRALNVYQCLQYALDRPGVISCLLGVRSKEDLILAAGYDDAPAEDRDYAFISECQTVDMKGVCVYCNHCLPCPVNIDIAAVNKFLDLYHAGDLLAKKHYQSLLHRAEDCIQCGHCMANCPFGVDVMAKLAQAQAEMTP
ncbi:aldo/keto reductase [Fusibacter paucivorans]|uniref:Aldo/keto reductase n=1 Tax=Fusibacter paucivorans TaxID=76009 RepID=A0ABS5PU28_9FIRM|nr:aldo/keto reductase [Fusibacter paucivorans]MBS7528588.1 aldo/keto reductase [Fusibacter paucivorans]